LSFLWPGDQKEKNFYLEALLVFWSTYLHFS
jgi:hypothetical protein